jgi:hypothetical protein
MAVTKDKDYVCLIVMCDDGDWHHMDLLDNQELSITTLLNKECELPGFMKERIALMCLCTAGNKGGVYGRRISEGRLAVYLTYREYTNLRQIADKQLKRRNS